MNQRSLKEAYDGAGGPRIVVFRREAEIPITSITQADMSWNRTGSWRYLRPKFVRRVPPCNEACPAGEDIEGVMVLVREGRILEALQKIREDNPFPAVCGRVCYHPCESSCNRGELDEPLAIQAVERFVADQGYGSLPQERPLAQRDKRIAVVGAGPSGLTCAYHMARMGYSVTVFEREAAPGGVLRIGIPSYRLPKDVLELEIERILSLGLELRTGLALGRDMSWGDLKKDFDAVYIATGALKERTLGIPGEDLEGVLYGLEFLKGVNSGRSVDVGRRVVVIGGGNTAMDCARACLRLGARPIILYRRTREEMPAIEAEVEEALEEGVEMEFLLSPVSIKGKDGHVEAIECVRNRLGKPDDSGRRRPEPIKGSEFLMEVDSVIVAAGEAPEVEWVPEGLRVEVGIIWTDPLGRTSEPNAWAGGDVASVQRMVVHAIGAGKRAALCMDALFRGIDPQEAWERARHGEKGSFSMRRYLEGIEGAFRQEVVHFKDLNMDYFTTAPRQRMPRLIPSKRLSGFHEVNLGLKEEMALGESSRCFNCAVCNLCGNCNLFCPDMSVRLGKGPYENSFDYEHCKGCGICAQECPRGAILMEEEVVG